MNTSKLNLSNNAAQANINTNFAKVQQQQIQQQQQQKSQDLQKAESSIKEFFFKKVKNGSINFSNKDEQNILNILQGSSQDVNNSAEFQKVANTKAEQANEKQVKEASKSSNIEKTTDVNNSSKTDGKEKPDNENSKLTGAKTENEEMNPAEQIIAQGDEAIASEEARIREVNPEWTDEQIQDYMENYKTLYKEQNPDYEAAKAVDIILQEEAEMEEQRALLEEQFPDAPQEEIDKMMEQYQENELAQNPEYAEALAKYGSSEEIQNAHDEEVNGKMQQWEQENPLPENATDEEIDAWQQSRQEVLSQVEEEYGQQHPEYTMYNYLKDKYKKH